MKEELFNRMAMLLWERYEREMQRCQREYRIGADNSQILAAKRTAFSTYVRFVWPKIGDPLL